MRRKLRLALAASTFVACYGFITWLIDLLEGYKPLIDIGLEG